MAAGDSLEILRRTRRPTQTGQEHSTAALRRVIALTAAPSGTGTRAMAYIFKESELPSLVSVVPGRERIFFVNQELAGIDDMLAGVMHYKKGAASPLHLHKNCEHFYFIISGKATVESDEGIRPVGPGDLIFIPAEEKHRLRATEPLFYFEFQAPNRFKTTILEGTDDDLCWERKDGRVWVQT
jgi:mannose-6-phosphate isomerase-like protein (cupin superfamily)